MDQIREVYPTEYYGVLRVIPNYWGSKVRLDKVQRGRARGKAFVQLYQAAKQLVDANPSRFPYLEYDVREIERLGLVPAIDRTGAGNNNGNKG